MRTPEEFLKETCIVSQTLNMAQVLVFQRSKGRKPGGGEKRLLPLFNASHLGRLIKQYGGEFLDAHHHAPKRAA